MNAREFTRAAFVAWLDKHRSIQKDAAQQPRQMTLRETVDALRAIPGSGWKDIDDPLAELRRMRGGDELAEERERCALIAETIACPITYGDYQNGWDQAATEIAAAIRRGE